MEQVLRSELITPSAGLFDRIILAIKKEKELRQTRKLLFSFFFLLIISSLATGFSWHFLVNQITSSGIGYFIGAAFSDLNIFFTLWHDFGLAILEALPVLGLVSFILSLSIAVFTLRLFLYKKQLLLRSFIS